MPRSALAALRSFGHSADHVRDIDPLEDPQLASTGLFRAEGFAIGANTRVCAGGSGPLA
jgi:hypothetical protein